MDIMNFIYAIFSSPFFWSVWILFFFGYTWTPKTETDEVIEEHINELQTKKVDKDTARRFPYKQTQALVTFTFDDAYETWHTKGRALFAAQGEVAVICVHTDAVDAGGGGVITWAQIADLVSDGWEVVNHSKTHTNLVGLTEAQIRTELDGSVVAFAAQGYAPPSFAYPGGASNQLARQVTRDYFRSALSGYIGCNERILNTFNLRRNLIDDHTELAAYKALIDTAEADKKWVIFVMHSIVDADDENTLNELIDYAQGKSIDIVTIEQGLDLVENLIDIGDNVGIGEKGLRAGYIEGPVIFEDGLVKFNDGITRFYKRGSATDYLDIDVETTDDGYITFKAVNATWIYFKDAKVNFSSQCLAMGNFALRGYLYNDDGTYLNIRGGTALHTYFQGNIGIGTISLGADMTKGFIMNTGVAPTGGVADCFQMYSKDIVGGNACPHIRTEDGDIIKLFQCAKADYNNWAAFADVVNALVAMGIFDAA